jgi:hypothetical protein
MKIIFKKYIVNSEVDFVEGEVEKINTHLTVCAGIEEDVDNLFNPLTYDLYVINLNSQTGVEMDEQRELESIQFINNKFNNL